MEAGGSCWEVDLKGFRIFGTKGFRIFGTKGFRVFWIQKVFVSLVSFGIQGFRIFGLSLESAPTRRMSVRRQIRILPPNLLPLRIFFARARVWEKCTSPRRHFPNLSFSSISYR